MAKLHELHCTEKSYDLLLTAMRQSWAYSNCTEDCMAVTACAEMSSTPLCRRQHQLSRCGRPSSQQPLRNPQHKYHRPSRSTMRPSQLPCLTSGVLKQALSEAQSQAESHALEQRTKIEELQQDLADFGANKYSARAEAAGSCHTDLTDQAAA